MKKVLFICSRNKLRSPTAEEVFRNHDKILALSAGLDKGSETPLSVELLLWADIIFVMEKSHIARLKSRFRQHLGKAKVISLDIPDRFDFMDPELIAILKRTVPKLLNLPQEA